ncbi:MAG: hypothetical protein AABY22_23480 [Nanoarchaeota archaeon]
MHFEKQKPRFQIRVLEYEKDGTTFKKSSKNSNLYPNNENYTLEQIWKKIKKAIEND